jgi:uncharacterized protein
MRRATVLIGLTAAILAAPVTAAEVGGHPEAKQNRPSFDCRRAGTRVEHLICGDAYLSQLDRRMANAYAAFQRRISSSERARLRENQRLWLADRNRCTTIGCLTATYEDRIAWLEGFGRY